MIAIGFTILLGALMLLAFGLMKLFSDWKCDALSLSKDLFDEHFSNANTFVNDSAAPIGLSNMMVRFSRAINNDNLGRHIVMALSERDFLASDKLDPGLMHLKVELEELRRHRPDLADAFSKAVASGFIAAAYRQAAREMSPIRAFREGQQARRAKKTKRPDDLLPGAFKAAQGFGMSYAG